jgi:hypothetical protein
MTRAIAFAPSLIHLVICSDSFLHRNFLQVAIKQTTFGRRIFWTAQGYLGIGPASMAEGNIICVFFGGHVLYVLRAAGLGLYECIGECYVYGLMDGEVFARERVLEDQFFTIIKSFLFSFRCSCVQGRLSLGLL